MRQITMTIGTFCSVFLATLQPVTASAQGCVSLATTLAEGTCVSDPMEDKFFAVEVSETGSGPRLFLNRGNELEVLDLTDPAAPESLGESNFLIGSLGDLNYDLQSFDVCDGCRYGVANFKRGTVVFDLESASDPFRWDFEVWEEADQVRGGMVFGFQGREYLIANDLPDGCSPANAGVYRIDEGPTLVRVACLEVPDLATQTQGGDAVEVGDTTWLYVADRSQQVHVFWVDVVDGEPSPVYVPTLTIPANQQRGSGFAIDPEALVMISDDGSTGLILWDLESPGAPEILARVAGDAPFSLSRRVAIQWPLAVATYLGTNLAPQLYDLSTPSRPVEISSESWTDDQPWNELECRREYDAAFSRDGSTLYMARYEVAQALDVAPCVTAPELDHKTVIPAAARTTGLSGSTFATDLVMSNRDEVRTQVRLDWRPRTGAAPDLPFLLVNLDPGESLRLRDLLGDWFLLEEGVGSVIATATSARTEVHARIYAVTEDGTFGQSMPGVPEADLYGPGETAWIGFLEEGAAVRSNIGIANGSGVPIRVIVTLLDGAGSELGEQTVDLPAWGSAQLNRPFSSWSPVEVGSATLRTTTEGGLFVCYGSVLDNGTNDPTTVMPR